MQFQSVYLFKLRTILKCNNKFSLSHLIVTYFDAIFDAKETHCLVNNVYSAIFRRFSTMHCHQIEGEKKKQIKIEMMRKRFVNVKSPLANKKGAKEVARKRANQKCGLDLS